jgi:hypothetical protein
MLKPGNKTHELSDRFFIGLLALFGAGQFGGAEHAGLAVAARP